MSSAKQPYSPVRAGGEFFTAPELRCARDPDRSEQFAGPSAPGSTGARAVRKAHTASPAAFVSAPLGPLGPLGWVHEGRASIELRPAPQGHVVLAAGAPEARVALLTAGLGDDGRLVRSVLADDFDGLRRVAWGPLSS